MKVELTEAEAEAVRHALTEQLIATAIAGRDQDGERLAVIVARIDLALERSQRRPRKGPQNEIRHAAIIAARRRGETFKAIATSHKISASRVREIVTAHERDRRRGKL